MAERIPAALQEKLARRLTFYQDIGIQLFYRDRYPQQLANVTEEITLPKPVQKAQPVKPAVETRPVPPKLEVFPGASTSLLFSASNNISVRQPRPGSKPARFAVCGARGKIADANDRSYGPAAPGRLHLQRREMPSAGKSHAGKR